MKSAAVSDVSAPVDLFLRIGELLPEIESRASACEEMRSVPEENVTALRAVGYLRAFMPKAYGGLEVRPSELFRATSALAGACPSTAWAMQLLIAHAHAIAYFDPRLQEEIWGSNRDALVSSSIAPVGKVTAVPDGYRLSGRFQWSSGCDHANWAMVGFLHENPQTGKREHMLAVVPRSDYRIDDTWFAAAMKGSGSKDIVIDDVFVPEYRVESLFALNFRQARGYGQHPGTLFRLPFQPIFAGGFSTVAVGIAKAMLDKYRARLMDRQRAYTGAKVAESAPSYMKLAESYHEVLASELILKDEWASMEEHAAGDIQPDAATFTRWRTNQAYATRLSTHAVNRLFAASGGSALFLTSALQRLFRDAQAASAHAYSDYDVASQILGRHLVGLPVDERLL